jgi:hypothetical protein
MWEGTSFGMRILLGLGRGLAFLYVLWCANPAFACDQLPEGEQLWVRLASSVSTYSAKVGDPVQAVLTQDVSCGSDVVLPMGSSIEGVVRSKRKVGWGIRHETSALELAFTKAVLADGSIIEMSARVEEVENAREQVKNGVIQGVLSSDTFQGRINSRLLHMPTWNPYSDVGLIVYKATFPIFPEPEIFYPSGTDMRLKLKAQVSLPALPANSALEASGAANDSAEYDSLVRQLPHRSTTRKNVDADYVNLVFLGSEQQVTAAFREAGWNNSDPVSKNSFMRNLYALLNNSGYAQQPMTTLLLDGKPQDMSWQKGLNSYGRRDHLRVWQWPEVETADSVWLSSSTHDTSAILSVKYHGFVHHISPDIDHERSKVVRDLNFAGCVQSVSYVARPGISTITQNATGDLMRTDGSVAVVQLKDCEPTAPGLYTTSANRKYRPGNYAFRYVRKQILTFRNDIWRANIIYGLYDVGRMAVTAMRHQPVPPLDGESKPTFAAAVQPVLAAAGSQ